MGNLESCWPAFPPAEFATAHAGSHDKQNSSNRGPEDYRMTEGMSGKSKLVLEGMRREKMERNEHIFSRVMYCDERDLMLYLESTTELMWKSVEMIYTQSKNTWKKGKDWTHRSDEKEEEDGETNRDDEVTAGCEVNREKLGGVTAYHPHLIEYRGSEGRQWWKSAHWGYTGNEQMHAVPTRKSWKNWDMGSC